MRACPAARGSAVRAAASSDSGASAAATSPAFPPGRRRGSRRACSEDLTVDRYWAKKVGAEPLPLSGGLDHGGRHGHASTTSSRAPTAGCCVTRFWYIRTVNPQTVQLTGLTRDGVWLIEKGKVVGPVNNFRFNDSPVNLLKNMEAMSAAVSTGDMVVPAIRARDFNFTSKSDAV